MKVTLAAMFAVVCSAAIGCSGVQTREAADSRHLEERVSRVSELVDELVKCEPAIKASEQRTIPTQRAIAVLETQMSAIVGRCRVDDKAVQVRSEEVRLWCGQQVAEICERYSKISPQVIDQTFALRAAYQPWVDSAQPLIQVLIDEHSDELRADLPAAHKQRMALALARLTNVLTPSDSSSHSMRVEWQTVLQSFGNVYRERGNLVEETDEKWRAYQVASVGGFCALLESEFIIQPSIQDLYLNMRAVSPREIERAK